MVFEPPSNAAVGVGNDVHTELLLWCVSGDEITRTEHNARSTTHLGSVNYCNPAITSFSTTGCNCND